MTWIADNWAADTDIASRYKNKAYPWDHPLKLTLKKKTTQFISEVNIHKLLIIFSFFSAKCSIPIGNCLWAIVCNWIG